MSFYDTQTYCGIVDMKVVVVGICNKINFTKVWITPTKRNLASINDCCYLPQVATRYPYLRYPNRLTYIKAQIYPKQHAP
jgi:hypothetical protein